MQRAPACDPSRDVHRSLRESKALLTATQQHCSNQPDVSQVHPVERRAVMAFRFADGPRSFAGLHHPASGLCRE